MDSKTIRIFSIVVPVTHQSIRQLIAGRLVHICTFSDTGTVSGGTFAVTINDEDPIVVEWDATAAEFLAQIHALDSITPTNVIASGGDFPGTSVVVTFRNMGKVTVTVDDALLTGSTPVILVTNTQVGLPALPKASSPILVSIKPVGGAIIYDDANQGAAVALADGIERTFQAEDTLSNIFVWSGGTITTVFELNMGSSTMD